MRQRIGSAWWVVLCLLVWGPGAAEAWGPTAHMVVAQIAYEELDDSTRAEVDRLIGLLAPFEPRMDHFVPASTWMDALRSGGPTAFDHWHYINLPVFEEGFSKTRNPNSYNPNPYNAVWAIRQAVGALSDPSIGDFQKAWMLRFTIHLVGDIHQPLHTVAYFGEGFPRGDRGGNLFTLRDPAHANLHRLWDGTAGLFPYVNPDGRWRPSIRRLAASLRREVSAPKDSDLHALNPDLWAEEGRRLAVSAVYADIEFEGHPSQAYLDRAQNVIEQQLLLGGYRLAAVLTTVLGER